jgi:GT2 family glycosyltransferase
MFWDAHGLLGMPAEKLKSILFAPAESVDHSSNFYRLAENVNLRRTIISNPLGIGFGHPFELYVPLADISFLLPNWQYHPHNMILGMWMTLGTVGFGVFLFYYASILMLAAFYMRQLRDDYLKAVCFFALSTYAAGFLVASVDQFIWSERGAIFMGLLVAMISSLGRQADRVVTGQQSKAPADTVSPVKNHHTDRQARVSVVIATYNRRKLLERALSALDRQTATPGTFEVIVVNDGSSDHTQEWLAQAQFGFACHTLSQANQGPASARNAGVNMAHGDIILFLDDDLVAEPELVAEHLRMHEDSPGNVVLGPASSLPRYKQPWVAWQQGTLEKAYTALSQGDITPSFRHFWSGNCSVHRSELLETGGYNATFLHNEDVELGYRLMQRGLRFIFNPAAKGYHFSTRSYSGWATAHAEYGRTNVEILRRSGQAEMYKALRNDWRDRHPLTRALAGWATRGPVRFLVASKGLSVLAHLGMLAPMSRFSQLTCAALANVLYWNGVHGALGNDWHLLSEVGGRTTSDSNT